MKKTSLAIIMLIIISSIFLMVSSVSADTGKTVMAYGTLQDAIEEADAGDIIQLTDKYYQESVNINKDITIRGPISGRSIFTKFNIVEGANKVKLENIKVSTRINEDCTLIDVKTQVDLEIAKFNLIFVSGGKEGNKDPWNIDSKIINMGEGSSHSKLNIHDSYLAGMFDTLNVESDENKIDITKTTLHSDCPIILKNGSNNKVTITESEINAGSSSIPSEEECISITGQTGTTIDFIDTTLKGMKIPAESKKTNDLISFDDANSTNVKVNFKGTSKIIDGNMVEGSDIFNFGTCPVSSGNTIYLENSVGVFIDTGTEYNQQDLKPATLEEKYNKSGEYAVVGVYDNNGATIKQYNLNETLPVDALPKKVAGTPGIPGKLGCDISNWYTDKDLSNEFKPKETQITKNMNLYPKYVDLVYVTIGEYNFELQKGQNLSNIDKDLTNVKTVDEALNTINQVDGEHFDLSRYVDNTGRTVEKEQTTFDQNAIVSAKFNVKVTVKDTEQKKREITIEEGTSLDDLLQGEDKNFIDEIKNAENFSRFVNEQEETVESSEPITKNTTLNVKHNVKLSFEGTDLVVDLEEGSTLQGLTEEERKVLEKLEVVEGKKFDHFEYGEGTKVDAQTTFSQDTKLTAKYKVKVKIGNETFEFDEGKALEELEGEDQSKFEKIINQEGKTFSHFEKADGSRVEKNDKIYFNTELTPKYTVKVKVTLNGMNLEFDLNENQSLNDLNEEKAAELDTLIIKSDKQFSHFVDTDGKKIARSDSISKNCELTPKYTITVKIKDKAKTFTLNEGENLNNLDAGEQSILGLFTKGENKTFSHFENERSEKILYDTAINNNVTLTPKFTVDITIGVQTFKINEGETLDDLDEDGKAVLGILKQDKENFSRFIDENGNTIETTTPITKHTTINAKFFMTITVKNTDLSFKLEEGKKLSELTAEERAKIEALKSVEGKKFIKFVDASGQEVTMDKVVNEDIELTPKYTITVTVSGETFTLNDGESLDNLGAQDKSRLDNLLKAEEKGEKTFSHFTNEQNSRVDRNTQLNKNTKLTPKYTVRVTINGQSYIIYEGVTLNDLGEDGKQELDKLQNSKNDFSRFVDEKGNTITRTTAIHKNTTISAKFNVTVTVKNTDLSFKLEEGKKLSELKNEEKAKIEELKNVSGKNFVKFVDANGKDVTMDKVINEDIELTPKYTITVTINGVAFTLNDGESLNNLGEQDKLKLDNLLKAEEKTFSHFTNEQNERVDKSTKLSKNTKLTPKYTVRVTINGQSFIIYEGVTLKDMGEKGKQELTNLQNSRKDFSRFVDEKGNTITLTTAIHKNTTISAKFKVSVTINGKVFKVEEGKTLNDLDSTQKSELDKLINVSGKTFSHFVDNNNTKIYKTTQISKDTTLTPKYTVTVTVKGKVYTLQEGQNLNNLTSTQLSEIDKLVTANDKKFSHFVDQENKRIEKTTAINKNTVLTPKYTITVTIKGKVYTLQEGQNLNNLTSAQLSEIDKLVVANNKTFSHLVDQEKKRIDRTTALNKNTVLTPKYTVTITIKGEKFIIYEGASLNDLGSANKARLEKLKKGEFWQKFSKFVNTATKATVTIYTPITTNVTLDVVLENIEESVATSSTKGVIYTTHVQDIGWQSWVPNGKMAGTTGKSYRLEGIKIKIQNLDETGGIIYNTHVQDIGWQGWKADGEKAGTSGRCLRLEAIKINLTGALAKKYDVYYRVHSEEFGWLGWAKNGESSGTAGYGYRLEAIEVKLVLKGSKAPGSTENAFHQAPPKVVYQTHVQDIGWQNEVTNGATAGTSGKALRLEGIRITLGNNNIGGGITYSTHVEKIGWQDWKNNGDMSGTSGKSLRLEAIKIKLTGEIANKYDIYYRVHSQDIGWMGWAKNGESSGTAGYGYRLEAIQIVLVAKGGKAPGTTVGAFKQK